MILSGADRRAGIVSQGVYEKDRLRRRGWGEKERRDCWRNGVKMKEENDDKVRR